MKDQRTCRFRITWNVLEIALLVSLILTLVRGMDYRQQAVLGRSQADSVIQEMLMLTTDHVAMSELLLGSQLPEGVVVGGRTQDGLEMSVDFSELDRPLVLLVVNPGCPGCLQEIPKINSKLREKRCAGEVALGIGLGPKAQVLEFASQEDLQFPILMDAVGSLWEKVPLYLSPLTLLLGKGGTIDGFFTGVMSLTEEEALGTWLDNTCSA